VDSTGTLLDLYVTSANISENEGGIVLAQRLHDRFPTLRTLKVDAGYKDGFVVAGEKLGFEVQVALRPPDAKGFVPLKGRWLVERTFAWLGRYRRLAKDYERYFQSSDSTLWFAMTHLLLRRLFPDSS
jgi:putative transposase